jgi:hypothetical protein
MSLPILDSCKLWNDKCMSPCPAIGWDGVLGTPCLSWPQTSVLLISVSQAARTRDVSHQHPVPLVFEIRSCKIFSSS